MRFLFVSDFLADPDSGAAGSLIAIGSALRARGHHVHDLWHVDGPLGPRFPALVGAVELPLRQLRQVRTALLRERYDVVIVSQPYAFAIYERLASAHPRTLFLNRTHGWEDRLEEVERTYCLSAPRSLPRALARVARRSLLHRWCHRTACSAHGIIAPSTNDAHFIIERYGIRNDGVAVIAYGVGPEFLEAPAGDRSPYETRMLFAGQYLARKGTGVLERTMPELGRRYPNLRLTMVVPPPDVARVDAIYRPAFGSRLDVLSWVTRQELRSIYLDHHVFLFPSYFEGFGKTFLEAMASGCCVVGFATGGLPDIGRNGENSLFCAAGDESAFAGLVARCATAPELVRKLGMAASEAARRYTWKRTAEATERFCLERGTALLGWSRSGSHFGVESGGLV